MNETIEPITRAEELNSLIRLVEDSPEIYFDTEADSLHHYFEKICLLQFTVPDGNGHSHFLVDPLASLDLTELFQALQSKLLVFHGADYDLRMLQGGFGFVPSQIFDTMLAARLCGHTGLGLDALVMKYTGKTLDHASQKADWSRRPLSERLLAYAVEDTKHLPIISSQLREELQKLQRTEWHKQQCAQLIELTRNGKKAAEEPWRIKGSFDFDPQKLAILRELWLWRDNEAREADVPNFRVCNNESLLEWVKWARENIGENLRNGPRIPHRWAERRYLAFKQAIQKAWKLQPDEWPPQAPRNKRPPFDPNFSWRMARLKSARDAIAKNLNLDPSILAPNSILEAISGKNPKSIDELKQIERWLPWQTEVLGQAFIESLQQAPPPA